MHILLTRDPANCTATLTAATVNGPVTIALRPNRKTRNNLLRQYWHQRPRPRFQPAGPQQQRLTF